MPHRRLAKASWFGPHFYWVRRPNGHRHVPQRAVDEVCHARLTSASPVTHLPLANFHQIGFGTFRMESETDEKAINNPHFQMRNVIIPIKKAN